MSEQSVSILLIPILLLTIVLQNPHNSTAPQDKLGGFEELLHSQNRFLSFDVNLEGKIIQSTPRVSRIPLIEFFTNPTISAELRLTDAQKASIQWSFVSFEKKLSKIRRRHERSRIGKENKDPNPQTQVSLADEMALATEKVLEDAQKALSRAQKVRLRELQWQFIVSRNGLFSVLDNRQAIELLGINWAEVSKLNLELPIDFESRIRKQEKQLAMAAMDDWLSGLSKEQRELFDRDWKKILSDPGGLGLLVWYLEYEKWVPYQPSISDKVLGVSSTLPRYLHGVDGNLSVVTRGGKASTSELQKIHELERMFNSLTFREFMLITDEQLAEIMRCSDEFFVKQRQVVDEVAGEYSARSRGTVNFEAWTGQERQNSMYTWPDNKPEIDLVIQKKLSSKASETRKQFLETLLPFQQEILKKTIERLNVRSRGPWAEIEFGGLGDEMKLTKDQRLELEGRREKIVRDIQVGSREIADEAFDELLSDLPPDIRTKIIGALGKPVSTGYRDLNTFVIGLMPHGLRLD